MRPADNPFRADRVRRVRYRPQGWTWGDLLGQLHVLKYRAAIVGAHGSGKTRLLRELGTKLREKGFPVQGFRVSPDGTSLPWGLLRSLLIDGGARHVILLDEADRLSACSRLALGALTRRAAGLIVTSHQPGRLPSLVRCAASMELLEDILSDLVGNDLCAIHGLSRQLFRDHHGNIHEVLRALYDVYADK